MYETLIVGKRLLDEARRGGFVIDLVRFEGCDNKRLSDHGMIGHCDTETVMVLGEKTVAWCCEGCGFDILG